MKSYPLLLASMLTAPLPSLCDTIVADEDSRQQRENTYQSQQNSSWQEAQQGSDSKHAVTENKTLSEQVVTASGYKQGIKEAPASISVVDREEILTRPIRDIGDAVQDVPGVYVEQDKTGQNQISMRGLGSEYTLILIDGKRQNTTRGFVQNGLGNQTSFMPPPSMIERIEVIRGPASIIYGSDAMGGGYQHHHQKTHQQTCERNPARIQIFRAK